jgi:hypothetical protein
MDFIEILKFSHQKIQSQIGGYSTRRTRLAAGLPLPVDMVDDFLHRETSEALGVVTDSSCGEALRDLYGRCEAVLLDMLGSLGNGGEFRLHLVLELARIDEKSILGDEGLARLRIPNDVTGSSKRRRILNLNRSCKYSLSKPEQIELRNLKKFTNTRLRRRPRRNLRGLL